MVLRIIVIDSTMLNHPIYSSAQSINAVRKKWKIYELTRPVHK